MHVFGAGACGTQGADGGCGEIAIKEGEVTELVRPCEPLKVDDALGTGWSVASIHPVTEYEDGQELAINADGSVALAVWSGANGEPEQPSAVGVHAARRDADGWTETQISPDDGVAGLAVAVDDTGDVAWVTWGQNTGQGYEVLASQWSGKEWQEPVRLSVEGESGLKPQLALSADGSTAAVVWSVGHEGAQLRGTWWRSGSWSPPETVHRAEGAMRIHSPRLALDAAGSSAMLVWQETEEPEIGYDMWATLYATRWSGAWDLATPISDEEPFHGGPPQLILTGDGSFATVAWDVQRDAGERLLLAANWTGEWQAPTQLGEQLAFRNLASGATSDRTSLVWTTRSDVAEGETFESAAAFSVHWTGDDWSEANVLFRFPDDSNPSVWLAQARDSESGLLAMNAGYPSDPGFFAVARQRGQKYSLMGSPVAPGGGITGIVVSSDGSRGMLGWLESPDYNRWIIAEFDSK
jgi:hypothetical protein